MKKPTIFFLFAIYAANLACVFQSVLRQNGISMEPTISDGQKMFTEIADPSDLERGDIVYFELSDTLLVKRIIGLPGEKVEVRDGNIYINDRILVEDYEASAPLYAFGPVILDLNQFIVLGDNRNDSKDSHTFGPITGDQIKGRVFRIQ